MKGNASVNYQVNRRLLEAPQIGRAADLSGPSLRTRIPGWVVATLALGLNKVGTGKGSFGQNFNNKIQ